MADRLCLYGLLYCVLSVCPVKADEDDAGGPETLFEPRDAASATVTDVERLPEGAREMECRYEAIDGGNAVQAPHSPAAASRRTAVSPSARCRREASVLIDEWKAGGVMLIDTRPAAAYSRWHVTGSLNIPLHAVKTKSFLKGKAFLLTGQGLAADTIESVCDELVASGFERAGVYPDGINEWRRRLGMDAPLDVLDELASTDPSRLQAASGAYRWIVLDMDNDRERLKRLFPKSVIVAYTTDDEALARRLSKHMARRDGSKPARLLLVSRDGGRYARASAWLRNRNIGPFFTLHGGADEYRRYLHRHATLLARKNAPPREDNRCGL